MNKILLMGRLCTEPEKRKNKSLKFLLAVPRYKDKSGDMISDFINVVAFDKTAEFINKYFHKGDKIIIEGRLQIDLYEDRYYTSVVVNNYNGVFFPESNKSKEKNKNDDDWN